MKPMTIGALSRQTGVKVPTIRFYEQIGLTPAPPRTESNRRTYDSDDVRRLRFIRHARELGFEMDAIRALLFLQDNPNQSCAAADEIARARLAEVEQRIESLSALQSELQRMVAECACGRIAECRVIDTLANNSHAHGRLA